MKKTYMQPQTAVVMIAQCKPIAGSKPEIILESGEIDEIDTKAQGDWDEWDDWDE